MTPSGTLPARDPAPGLTLQLAFPFPHRDAYRPDALIEGAANAEALAWLRAPLGWPGLRLALHGDPGAGKTHHLHAFASRHGALLLHGPLLRQAPQDPVSRALAIDDADRVPAPEPLLHWLNAAQEAGIPVLLAGQAPPARWPVALPDLASRLRAMTAVRLLPPDDEMRQALLAQLIAERQLRVEPAVQDYLLIRLPRDCAALREAAARLDRKSLAAGKRVNRALAADTLAELEQERGE